MQLNGIYDPAVTFPAVSATPYDPTQEQKTWSVPLKAGDDPTDAYVYNTAQVDISAPAPYVTWHEKVLTKGQAAATNWPLPGWTPGVGVTQVSGAVAIPMVQALIPAGYTLTGTPFGLLLVANTPAPAPAAPSADPTEARILAGIEEELAHDNLPPV